MKGALGATGVAATGVVGGAVGRTTAPESQSAAIREARDSSVAPTGTQGWYGTRQVIWSVDTTERAVALTFDDGPDPELTPTVLELLARHDIRSTFCCMGWNVEKHPQLFDRVVAADHEIGNHGWSHRNLAQFPASMAESEIRRSHELLTARTGTPPRWYRPPRGELTGAAVRLAGELGCDVLLWSYYGDLPGEEQPEEVRKYVVENLRPGAIIDLHDGIGRGTFDRNGRDGKSLLQRRHAELAALGDIISDGLAQGYRFVTASELVSLREVPTT